MAINEEKRKIQEEAVTALLENEGKGIVILPTGTGKSYVLIECLRRLYEPGMRILYTCDSRKLRDSEFDKELEKWDASEYIPFIQKECYASAYKLKDQHFDILLADEGDYALTPEYSKLFFNNTFSHIIFVSATLESKKVGVAKQIAPIVYQKQIKEIEDKGVINRCKYIYVPYHLNNAENQRYIEFNKRFQLFLNAVPPPNLTEEKLKKWEYKLKKDLEFLNIERLHFLAGLDSSVYICRKLMHELYMSDPHIRMLIFCGLNAQADRVCKYSYHTKNEELDNLKKFEDGDIQAAAVCGKINRGINITGVNNIILENCNRSETVFTQRTGRGRRLDVNDFLYVYILIPYYKDENGKSKATIVKKWVEHAGRKMGIENATVHYIK